jgi:hypothetical protein
MNDATVVRQKKSDNWKANASPSKNIFDYRNYQRDFPSIQLEAFPDGVYTLP